MQDRPGFQDILDAMDQATYFEDGCALIHRHTGELFVRMDEDFMDQPEVLETLERVEEDDDWICLPDRFDLDEPRLMIRFSYERAEGVVQERLLGAMGGRGTFRRFKEAARRAGLLDEWFAYRDRAEARLLAEFLEVEGIPFEPPGGGGVSRGPSAPEGESVVEQRVRLARAHRNPAVICRVPSGWAVLADRQVLPGYALLLSDPVVPDLHALDGPSRARFLRDMVLVGEALQEVTGAERINYEILGNSDPTLHAHLFPRYADEDEALRGGPPWRYPEEAWVSLDVEREAPLILELRLAIERRLR